VNANAQEKIKYKLDAVVVTASRIPTIFLNTPRTMSIIDKTQIKTLPVHSVQELLEYTLGVDLRQRGPFGVQADISIRGSGIDQTLIMINGTKINDSQTGHHNLNIPINLNDIEKIEILKGPGSTIYGANAVGGVVNIITKNNFNKSVNFRGTVGDFRLYDGELSISLPMGKIGQQLSFSKKKSAGYRENTDFDISMLSYSSQTLLGNHKINLHGGYLDKQFGANSFYSTRFPYQWEQTQTAYLSASSNFKMQQFSFTPKIYWRRNEDNFLLDRKRPSFYHNHHITNNYVAEIQATFRSLLGVSVLGGEFGFTEIKSSNLGKHNQTRDGFFFQQQFKWNQFLAVPGFFLYRYSDWGWKAWPGINVGLNLFSTTQLYSSLSQAYRIPTYTELFYKDPANLGNPNLKPEEAWTYELGLKWRKTGWEGNIAAFRRQGNNLIDWIRFNENDLWQALNFTEVNTNGLEVNLWFYPLHLLADFPINRINLYYTTLHSDKNTDGFTSKYVLDYLKHQINLNFDLFYTKQVRQNWQIRYKERIGYSGVFLFDTKILYNLIHFELFLEGTNLLNQRYSEVGSIPLPGRWLRIGFLINPTFN
jgi:vitamin B12 transporter